MIPEVFPDLYDENMNILEDELDVWNNPSLLKLFNCLSQQTVSTTKFCFFVDGLDEYESDSIELIEDLRTLAKSPIIKLCVSNRPWHVFNHEYGRSNSRMLKLEDLTRNKISFYASLVRISADPIPKAPFSVVKQQSPLIVRMTVVDIFRDDGLLSCV